MADTQSQALRAHFAAGARAVLPVLIGAMPFAVICGAVAVRLELSVWAAAGLSLFVFAGASQLATIQLLHDGAPLLIVFLTVFFINLRFTMYSASIAPYFRGTRATTKAGLAYLLTDQAYVLGLHGFTDRHDLKARIAFYLGVGLTLWFGWQLATLLGAAAGARLPESWALEFAIPLTFMAMAMPAIRDKSTVAAALIGGAVGVVGHGLPWNLGLILGALSGIAAGVLVARAIGEGEPS